MGIRIATNMAALRASRALATTSDEQAKSYERLSSGSRITTAGDDAAGLSISENLRAQVRSLGQAQRNANDGVSFSQVAEGGLTESTNLLVRLRELAIQAASDTVGDRERSYINQEAKTLVAEVDRIANVTNFNGTPLLNGSSRDLQIQVGTQNHDQDRIQFSAADNDVRASSLGIGGLDYTSTGGARSALESLDDAMNKVAGSRARLGALQNNLNSASNSIGVEKENLSAARSRIADTDVATETSALVRGNILQSAGVAVLAQANQTPAQALKLL